MRGDEGADRRGLDVEIQLGGDGTGGRSANRPGEEGGRVVAVKEVDDRREVEIEGLPERSCNPQKSASSQPLGLLGGTKQRA